MVRWPLLAALAFASWACVSPPQDESHCVPGKSEACTCEDGRLGAHSCDDQGEAFGACECGPIEDTSVELDASVDVLDVADAGVDVGGDIDASTPDLGPSDLGPPDSEPQDVGPVACEPPLTLPIQHYGLPYSTVSLKPSGGTGAYHFTLTKDGSGALLDGVSGLHVLGGEIGSVDTVEVSDLGCIGTTSTDIMVIERFEVAPTQIQVPTGGGFTFEVSKGSGFFSFTFLNNGSGAVLDGEGNYVAGDVAGVDSIEIQDVGEGTVKTAGVVVADDVELSVTPTAALLLQWHAILVNIGGGSGHLTLAAGGDVCSYMDAMLLCEEPGTHQLSFTDNYTGASVDIEVTVAESLVYTAAPGGDQIEQHFFRTVGDLDSDGIPDAVFGSGPASVEANNGGALYVYRGQPDGLEPTPAQVIGHGVRNDRLGSSYAVGDFNGDGVKDIVAGVPHTWGEAGEKAGSAIRYAGLKDGFFEPEPAQVWEGLSSYGYFGYSTAACDFNGDGVDDLAIGAYGDEDKTGAEFFSQQGVVYIYLGGVLGLPDVPDMWLGGKKYQNSAWVGHTELRLGKALAVGDVNNDGLCDLAASGEHPYASSCDDGAVMVYLGTDGGAESLGGLEEDPAYAVRGPSCKAQWVGLEIAMGDVDNDQLADVIIGHKGHIPEAAIGTGTKNHGTVRILQGSQIVAHIGEGPGSADALPHLLEAGPDDNEGYWVTAGDVNGDGIDDVISGSIQDEVAASNVGTLRVFFGQDGAVPSAEPSLTWAGTKSGDRFGIVAGFVGDLDGDEVAELITLASREDTIAHDLGRLYSFSGSADSVAVPLEVPEEPSGQQFGVSVALFSAAQDDVTVAVSAPQHNRPDMTKAGGVYLYSMTAGVVDFDNVTLINDHPKSSNSKQFGYRVANAGDFDGDGVTDLALISYTEHQPGGYTSAYECGPSCGADAGTTACGTYTTNVGGLYVYRGKGDGTFEALPAFVYYSTEKDDKTESVIAVGNVDGDPVGRSDLAIGSHTWDVPSANAGGVRLITGRAYTVAAGKIQVICEASESFVGTKTNDYAGRSIAGLGDLNGDGCDDFAYGLERYDGMAYDRGGVSVVFGAGGPGCPGSYKELRLVPENEAKYAGWALAGGSDVDGDDISDLVVGIPDNSKGLKTGRAVLVSGAYLKKLLSEDVAEASMYDPESDAVVDIMGEADGARCGAAVSLLDDYEADGRAALAVGCPYGKFSGVAKSGGAGIYRYTPGEGFVTQAVLTIAGETLRPSSEAGVSLAFIKSGGGHVGAIGAAFGNSNSLDAGSAYVFFVEAP